MSTTGDTLIMRMADIKQAVDKFHAGEITPMRAAAALREIRESLDATFG